MRTPYHLEDVAFFLQIAPYLRLAVPAGARSFLARQTALIEECGATLTEYPDVLVEPLEFFYTTLRGLGALDRPFLELMLRKLTWRGVVWGGWLALMAPCKEYASALRSASVSDHRNMWSVRCALAVIEGSVPPDDLMELESLATKCRSALRQAQIAKMPIRSEPTETEMVTLQAERDSIASAYRRGGVEEAHRVLQSTHWRRLVLRYEDWYREHCGRVSRQSTTDSYLRQ